MIIWNNTIKFHYVVLSSRLISKATQSLPRVTMGLQKFELRKSKELYQSIGISIPMLTWENANKNIGLLHNDLF